MDDKDHNATVAVVTGAARGVGRGVALVLGDMGATVYVTDREAHGRKATNLPGTVEETSEQVNARGGHAIPVPLDHLDDAAVAALFERIDIEQGGLDLLVANASTVTRSRSRAAPSGRCRSRTGGT